MELMKDELLTDRCNEFTRKMLELGMDINRICFFVKDYQRKYKHIKENDEELAKVFTFDYWWKWSNTNNETFKTSITDED